MFSVESYVEEVRFNLEKKSNELIESFKALENVRFSEETAVLVVWAYFSLDDIHLLLEAQEDMFDSVHPIEGSDYTFNVTLLTNFALYDEDTKNFNEKEEEMFSDFHEDNDLEEVVMKEVSQWIKSCFDLAQVTLPLPIYFRYPDEEDALNLVTGKWEDQMEIEL